ncbi:MAG: FtsQ-type POTRA domain-containing protein [Bryobacteraceae bacterium]|nr:FtsQ-type POTRA domain-containing protein [Bryobacteraceae bacterium]
MGKKKGNGERPRRAWRAALPWVLSTLSLAAALVAGVAAFQQIERLLIEDRRFALGSAEEYSDAKPDIRIAGVEHASPETVMNVFAADAGRSLYLFPIEARRRRLLAVDWVKNASVARIWPNRLEVKVEERQPVAFVQLPPRRSGQLYNVALIDNEGVILEKPPGATYDLPVLTGLRDDQSAAMRAVRVRRYLQMCAELADELCGKVSEVDVADPNNLRIRMTAAGDSVLLTLGREHYLARVRRFLDHYAEIHRRLPAATRFDLRLDDRITAVDGVTQ